MTELSFDVVGIGNAIVDVLTQADDALVDAQGLPKGSMTLIDGHRAEDLYAQMGPAREISGGSAANTLAGVAALGGRAAFIGKVRNDQLGGIFRHDIRAAGVHFETPPATSGPPSGRCLIFVTPDAQRTMATFLGAANELGPDAVDPEVIAAAKVTYMEGYLFDRPAAKEAFIRAAEIARGAGRKVSLTLSDPFCVERHRAAFRDLVEHHIDILFANEQEICALYEVGDFDAALQAVRQHCEVAALTRSEHGSVVLAGDEVHVVDAAPLDRLVDTTGAGDLYAAGFLFGYTRGDSLYDCGRIGAIAAAEVISHFGARPEVDLARHLEDCMAAPS
ncbi:MAG: adenosine kinase [Kiloniellales bacterium]|nr:adenosine kinase [Kiloniellales bacterium]MDJ0970090.1 adenosine kinase [Kiloniellales bacterium]